VQAHQHTVLGQLQIRLNVVSALLNRQAIGRQGVFWGIGRSASMGDVDFPPFRILPMTGL
jgi:hypothetical protein